MFPAFVTTFLAALVGAIVSAAVGGIFYAFGGALPIPRVAALLASGSVLGAFAWAVKVWRAPYTTAEDTGGTIFAICLLGGLLVALWFAL